MRLTVLGSGTCVPSARRGAPGYYLEAGGMKVIVDCGSGTVRQLVRAGKDYRDIDAILLTHTHPDHVSDLTPLIHALVGTPGFERKRDLPVYGPDGIEEYYDRCVASLLRKPRPFSVHVAALQGKFDLGRMDILVQRTVHSDDSVAYRFEEDEKVLVITGDCDYDEGIVMLSQGADVLITDCSYPDVLKTSGHMTPQECGQVAKRAGVKKLVLSHIYPSPFPEEERVKEAKAAFDGEVVLAEDLMEFAI